MKKFLPQKYLGYSYSNHVEMFGSMKSVEAFVGQLSNELCYNVPRGFSAYLHYYKKGKEWPSGRMTLSDNQTQSNYLNHEKKYKWIIIKDLRPYI